MERNHVENQLDHLSNFIGERFFFVYRLFRLVLIEARRLIRSSILSDELMCFLLNWNQHPNRMKQTIIAPIRTAMLHRFFVEGEMHIKKSIRFDYVPQWIRAFLAREFRQNFRHRHRAVVVVVVIVSLRSNVLFTPYSVYTAKPKWVWYPQIKCVRWLKFNAHVKYSCFGHSPLSNYCSIFIFFCIFTTSLVYQFQAYNIRVRLFSPFSLFDELENLEQF